jgi:hypothetical protein
MTIRAKALTTFMGDYGSIRAGQIFICDPIYFQHLRSKHMAEEAPPLKVLGPSRHQALIEAPKKAQAPQLPGDSQISTAAESLPDQNPSPLEPPADGQAKPPSASRRGHRSSRRTSIT